MSKDELLAEILRLPFDEGQELIELAAVAMEPPMSDPDMTPALRAELERRYEDMLQHPEDGSSWEEVSAQLLARKSPKS